MIECRGHIREHTDISEHEGTRGSPSSPLAVPEGFFSWLGRLPFSAWRVDLTCWGPEDPVWGGQKGTSTVDAESCQGFVCRMTPSTAPGSQWTVL